MYYLFINSQANRTPVSPTKLNSTRYTSMSTVVATCVYATLDIGGRRYWGGGGGGGGEGEAQVTMCKIIIHKAILSFIQAL